MVAATLSAAANSAAAILCCSHPVGLSRLSSRTRLLKEGVEQEKVVAHEVLLLLCVFFVFFLSRKEDRRNERENDRNHETTEIEPLEDRNHYVQ